MAAISVYDSLLGETYYDHGLFVVAYDPVWQHLRRSCVFVPTDKMRVTLAALEAYTTMAKDDKDLAFRLYRVHRILNSVPIGQKYKNVPISFIDKEGEAILAAYREQVLAMEKDHPLPKQWDWNDVRKSARRVHAVFDGELEKQRRELQQSIAHQKTRPKFALKKYLSILEEVMK